MASFAIWIFASLFILSVEYSHATDEAGCDSFLRNLFPHLFTYCNDPSPCAYGPWGRWSYTGVLKTDSRCESGKVRQYNRTRTASTEPCKSRFQPQNQEKYECEPTLKQTATLIIENLKLGADAENPPTDRFANHPSTLAPMTLTRPTSRSVGWFRRRVITQPPRVVYRPAYCPTTTQQSNNRVCGNIGCANPTGKRSIDGVITPETKSTENVNEVIEEFQPLERLDPSIPVEEFDLEKYRSSIHENRKKRQCTNNPSKRYVLFIVDTSGSIGATDFEDVKRIIADISGTLCDHLKVGLLTYSDSINLEFCFKCYNDRRDIKNAILRTRYRGGLTHTTDAIKCACEEILTSGCGLPQGIKTPNIDVVLLTDGMHNGPCRNQLDFTVKCLHDKANINTFGIGIGNKTDFKSVRAITNSVGSNIFRVDDIPKLKKLLAFINQLLSTEDSSGDPVYSCVGHDARPCRK